MLLEDGSHYAAGKAPAHSFSEPLPASADPPGPWRTSGPIRRTMRVTLVTSSERRRLGPGPARSARVPSVAARIVELLPGRGLSGRARQLPAPIACGSSSESRRRRAHRCGRRSRSQREASPRSGASSTRPDGRSSIRAGRGLSIWLVRASPTPSAPRSGAPITQPRRRQPTRGGKRAPTQSLQPSARSRRRCSRGVRRSAVVPWIYRGRHLHGFSPRPRPKAAVSKPRGAHANARSGVAAASDKP